MSAAEQATAAAGITMSASSGQGDYRPEYAVDNNFQTRWGSDFNDNQWIQIDFSQPKTIVGLRLHWETAYGRDYDINIISEGNDWQTIYQVRNGDGGMDEIYFGPKKVSSLRLQGHKRGTGWGYSLWELEYLDEEFSRSFSASSMTETTSPEMIMDGDTRTSWQTKEASAESEESITVQFKQKTAFGGVQINWDNLFDGKFSIESFNDTSGRWMTINECAGSTKNIQDIYFNKTETTKLKFVFPLQKSQKVSIGEIALKGPDETWNPIRFFEMASQQMPDGILPDWLNRKQTFWTVSGLPNNFEESLLDEYGRVEPIAHSFSLVPCLIVNNKVLTAKDFNLQQKLANDWAPIPSVVWDSEDLELSIEMLTTESESTLASYIIKNKSGKNFKAKLAFGVYPLQINPPWQYGGFSPINDARWVDNNKSLIVNGNIGLIVDKKPANAILTGRKTKNIYKLLKEGKSTGAAFSDKDGIVIAGFSYDLSIPANGSEEIRMLFPMSKNNSQREDIATLNWNETKSQYLEKWKGWTGDWDINLPDQRLENIVRSNLAYLRINADGPAVQPGSRNYNHSWIRDGAISATAMLRFGLHNPVEQYVEWFSKLIHDDGFVPFLVETKTGHMVGFATNWKEYDSFGQYFYLMRQYWEITDDDKFIKKYQTQMISIIKMVDSLINTRLTEQFKDTEYFGILPESNSHEGYFPGKHSYWDDFWCLRGLQDVRVILDNLDSTQNWSWVTDIENSLRTHLLDSIAKVRKDHNLSTLPACAELGDFDPTSTSIGIMAADEKDTLPQDALKETYDRYYSGCLDRMKNKFGAQYTPYEVRNISALIRLGRTEDAWMLTKYFIKDAVRPAGWNHMAEVVHDDPRTPSYIGDMPHTWVGAGFINAVRDMLVYEDNGQLVLAAGIPDEWLDKTMEVKNLQTWWGPISYKISNNSNNETVLELLTTPNPPNGFIVRDGIKLIK